MPSLHTFTRSFKCCNRSESSCPTCIHKPNILAISLETMWGSKRAPQLTGWLGGTDSCGQPPQRDRFIYRRFWPLAKTAFRHPDYRTYMANGYNHRTTPCADSQAYGQRPAPHFTLRLAWPRPRHPTRTRTSLVGADPQVLRTPSTSRKTSRTAAGLCGVVGHAQACQLLRER